MDNYEYTSTYNEEELYKVLIDFNLKNKAFRALE